MRGQTVSARYNNVIYCFFLFFHLKRRRRSARQALVAMDAQQFVLQLVNRHVAHHHHPHHHHHAPSQYQCHAHSQDPQDNQDAWDHQDYPDVVDSPVPPDVWDPWDLWDHPAHQDAPVFQHLHLHPAHQSVFTTVWKSVLSHAVLLLPQYTSHLLPLPLCQFVLHHVPQPAVNRKRPRWKPAEKSWFTDLPYGCNSFTNLNFFQVRRLLVR